MCAVRRAQFATAVASRKTPGRLLHRHGDGLGERSTIINESLDLSVRHNPAIEAAGVLPPKLRSAKRILGRC
jgi:hypothetical protein